MLRENKGGGPRSIEEKAERELLDNETRKDTHKDDSDEPKPKDLKLGAKETQ